MNESLGVVFVGLNGAVTSTIVAGVALMKKGLSPRNGMLTDGPLAKMLDVVPLEKLVFGGWDLRADSVYDAALSHGVVPKHMLDQVKDELVACKPWPGVVSSKFLHSLAGKHLVGADTFRDEIKILSDNIAAFKKQHNLDRVVMVNLASTEKFTELSDIHLTVPAFEAALNASDARISPAMKYLYVACKMNCAHVNFTPSLSKIPALEKLSETAGIPICGEDGKTGQTMMKTVLAPAFAIREFKVEGWYSTNILGNNDGLVLNDPESNKTKVQSKIGVIDDILGYKVPNHQVHIHYYPPRGDAKEAWDNIDIEGFLGERMQIKLNFLCKDSILAAPLVIDLFRLMDVAHRNGDKGIQRQMSLFFKSPYATEGERPMHDLFKQYAMLEKWAKSVTSQVAKTAPVAAVAAKVAGGRAAAS